MIVSRGPCLRCSCNRNLFDGLCASCRSARIRNSPRHRETEEEGIAHVRARRLVREAALEVRVNGGQLAPSGTDRGSSAGPVAFPFEHRQAMKNLRKCPRSCGSECDGCFGVEGGHHWIEVNRDQVIGPYRCRNCGAKATCAEVWDEEIRRGH